MPETTPDDARSITGTPRHVRTLLHQHRWVLGVWLAGVVCLYTMLLPAGSPLRVGLVNTASVTALLIFLWAAIRMRPGARAVWWCMWIYLLLTVSGDIVYDVYLYHLQQEPFPAWPMCCTSGPTCR